VIRIADPDGLLIELVASVSTSGLEPWSDSDVPVEYSLRGFHGVSIALEGYERTAKLLTETFGYRLVEQSGNRFRFAALSEAGAGMEGFDYERARIELRIPDEFQVEAMAAVGRPGAKELLPGKLQKRESPNDRRKVIESISEGPF